MNTGAAGANTFVENQAGPLAASVVLTEPPSSDERLIQHILEATGKKPTPAASRLDQFLREPSGNKALLLWLGRSQPVANLHHKFRKLTSYPLNDGTFF